MLEHMSIWILFYFFSVAQSQCPENEKVLQDLDTLYCDRFSYLKSLNGIYVLKLL